VTRILLTNDDGVYAEGLRVARGLLESLGEVTVVAPDREMSGASHSLTLNHPLRIEEVAARTFAVNGTPTDCVNLAVNQLLAEPPDLVFSGINRGSNIGLDITYSGTVSAAFEGAINGIAALAVSIERAGDLDRESVARVVTEMVGRVVEAGHPILLNVNVPAGEILGIQVCSQGDGGFRSEIIQKVDPRGKHYYWIGGSHAHDERTQPADTDIAVLKAGYVAVTPLSLDLTDHGAIETLRRRWLSDASGDDDLAADTVVT